MPALHQRGRKSIAFIAREREASSEQPAGRAPAKISKREIARAFDIKGDDRIALKRLLKELEAEGAIERRRKGLHKAGPLPERPCSPISSAATATATFRRARRLGSRRRAARRKSWSPSRRRQKPGTPAPGVGDRALLRVEPLPDAKPGEPAYSGRVVKLLERAQSQILGIFRAKPARGGGRIAPIDKKNVNRGELDVCRAKRARRATAISSPSRRCARAARPSLRPRARAAGSVQQREGGEPHRHPHPQDPRSLQPRDHR